MSRVKRGVTKKARHKKILKLAKGYRGRAKNCFRIAIEKVEKALRYSYRDRKVRKRDFRGLWIQRINAGVREHGLIYSKFINVTYCLFTATYSSLEEEIIQLVCYGFPRILFNVLSNLVFWSLANFKYTSFGSCDLNS